MENVQESLAGRVAVLNMTSLSQAEICGEDISPFTVDLSELSERKKQRHAMDVNEVYERIFKGSMPALVSGAVICMKPELGAIDRENFIVPVWMI